MVNIGSTRYYSKLIKVSTILDNEGSDQKHLSVCSINPSSVANKSYSLLNNQNYNNISRASQEIELPVSIPLLPKLENKYLANSENYGMQRIEVRIIPQCRKVRKNNTNGEYRVNKELF